MWLVRIPMLLFVYILQRQKLNRPAIDVLTSYNVLSQIFNIEKVVGMENLIFPFVTQLLLKYIGID